MAPSNQGGQARSAVALTFLCTVFFAGARPAQAGINVSDEPRTTRWELRELASHPTTPLSIEKEGGGVFAIDQVSTCVGDCDGNDRVAIDELVLGVNIVLGPQSVNACPAFASSLGTVDIARLIQGVNNALKGCNLDIEGDGIADPRPLPDPYPALDAAVDAFNFYWNEMQ